MQQHPEQAHVDMSRRYAGTFSSPLWQVVPLLVLALLAFTGSGVHGDTVYLKNGSSIDGVFIGKHEGHVILQIGNLGKMEFPEEEVLTIEKNARTGPVNRKRNEKKSEENPLEKLDELKKSRKKPEEKSSQEALPIDPGLESEIQALVYDLTRQRSTKRHRAEKKLAAIGKPVIPYLLPVTSHPSELTRIAAFRILKKYPDFSAAEASLQGLTDSNRFARKLAWETLQEISGKRWIFPWDDSASPRDRQRAKVRWLDWWSEEKARIEQVKSKQENRD